jgi:cysteine desulfurase/selenocysteine lyase
VSIEVDKIKKDFPIFKNREEHSPFVYLDSAASSQKPQQVIDAMDQYYSTIHANVHRGVYDIAEKATALYEEARSTLGKFIKARHPSKEIVFTKNATEAINLVAYAWGLRNLSAKDKIVLTELEHHANIVPWQIIKEIKDVELAYIPIDEQGYLDLTNIDKIIKDAKLLALSLESNVLGTLTPAKYLTKLAHDQGALVLLDGAQFVPHNPTDVLDLDCDFLAITGHKMLGPTGIGALYAKLEHLENMPSFLGGGEMISNVELQSFTPNEVPLKFEAGTPPIAEAVGLRHAICYLANLGMNEIRSHSIELSQYALDLLTERLDNEIKIFGPSNAKDRGPIVSFDIKGIHPHDISQVLDSKGICVRAGHHCAKPLMRRLNVSATTRASFYIYNDIKDIDKLCEGLEYVIKFFK